jgi:hypothetical protein
MTAVLGVDCYSIFFNDLPRNSSQSRVLYDEKQREDGMRNIKVLGAAAAIFSILIASAGARNVVRPPSHPAQSIFCATREAGNPHSQYCDYIAWSKWRQRGAWDSSLDNACLHDPGYVPGECSFNAQGQVLFGAHR